MSYWSSDSPDTDRDELVFGRDLIGLGHRGESGALDDRTSDDHDERSLQRPAAIPRRKTSRRELRARAATGKDLQGAHLSSVSHWWRNNLGL